MTRNELSKRNRYYLPKNRYMELRYLCLQYPDLVREMDMLNYISKHPDCVSTKDRKQVSDPTGEIAISRERLSSKVSAIEKAARLTDPELSSYILRGVTKETTYESLDLIYNIPCGRQKYFNLRRRFFYILSDLV